MALLQEFGVWLSNLNGCAVGISDILWKTTVSAGSEEAAIELGIAEARIVNERSGLPPHGIKVSEKVLRYLAFVVPDLGCTRL